MRQLKKSLSLTLVLALICGLFCISASASGTVYSVGVMEKGAILRMEGVMDYGEVEVVLKFDQNVIDIVSDENFKTVFQVPVGTTVLSSSTYAGKEASLVTLFRIYHPDGTELTREEYKATTGSSNNYSVDAPFKIATDGYYYIVVNRGPFDDLFHSADFIVKGVPDGDTTVPTDPDTTTDPCADGHDYTSRVTREPTATQEGVRTYTCSRCGDSYTESIPTLGTTPTTPDKPTLSQGPGYAIPTSGTYTSGQFGLGSGLDHSVKLLTISNCRPRHDFATINVYDQSGAKIKPDGSYFANVAYGCQVDAVKAGFYPNPSDSTDLFLCKATFPRQYTVDITVSNQTITLTEGDTLNGPVNGYNTLALKCDHFDDHYSYYFFYLERQDETPGFAQTQPTTPTQPERPTQPEQPTTPSQPEQPKPEQGGDSTNSGSASLSKLSKQEITDLLNSAPTTMPDDIFVSAPSCTAPYATGKVRQEVLDAAAARLNVLRRIAGLPAVTADPALCEQAQYGAVILGKLGGLDHHPSKPSDMDNDFYQKAYNATSTSNLFAGRALLDTPDGFMDDSDANNVDRVGHRRWQLNPSLGKVGFGYVNNALRYGSFTAEKVFDQSGKCTDYNYISWPASGNFPNDLDGFKNNTAWSVSVNPRLYQTPKASDISVTLTRGSDGKAWSFSGQNSYTPNGAGMYFNVNNGGYGIGNCIIFRPNGISKYEGVYTVEITGLKNTSGSAASLSYQVDFFSTKDAATKPTNPEIPTTPTTPTNPTTPTKPTNPTTPAQTKTANPTNDKLTVNGAAQNPTVYKIGGSNYFKIRDVAAVLNGTEKQFSVGYSGGKVAATSGQPYEMTGTELKGAPAASGSATPSNDKIVIDGVEADVTVYKIGGANYFKLRDLGKALNFYVGWTAGKGVYIETDKPYSE